MSLVLMTGALWTDVVYVFEKHEQWDRGKGGAPQPEWEQWEEQLSVSTTQLLTRKNMINSIESIRRLWMTLLMLSQSFYHSCPPFSPCTLSLASRFKNLWKDWHRRGRTIFWPKFNCCCVPPPPSPKRGWWGGAPSLVWASTAQWRLEQRWPSW